MRTKFSGILTLLLALVVQLTFAQERTISGTVTDSEGLPLPGVNILVKGTRTGTQSDFDGNYSINANPGATIVYSYVSFKTVEQLITNNTNNRLDLRMEEDSAVLDEVVVTAYGIERKEKSLAYSTETIKTEELNQAAPVNAVTALQGKSSGLNIITKNNGINPSTSIILRGYTSVTGDNGALIVIDGVIQANSALDNLNPSDIATSTILKGASATALYGSQGANGAIIIETRKGSKNEGLKIGYTTSTTFEKVKYFPETQTKFGPGLDNFTYDPLENTQWGPRYDGVPRRVGPILNDGTFQVLPYAPIKDERENFFRTGLTLINNIDISGGDDKSTFFFSARRADIDGIVPNDKYRKDNFRLNASRTEGKFKISTNISFFEDKENVAGAGGYQGRGVYWSVINTPSNIPLTRYKNWRTDKFSTPETYFNEYYQNPYTVIDIARDKERSTRLQAVANFDYKFTDWLSARYSLSGTYFNEETRNEREALNYDPIQAPSRVSSSTPASVFQRNLSNKRVTSDFILTFNKDLTEDINATLILGNNIRTFRQTFTNVSGTDLVVPGLYDVGVRTGELAGGNSTSESKKVGYFADLTIGLKDWIFINGAYRYDQSSTLPLDNNGFDFYTVGGTFVLTDGIEGLKSDALSYFKVLGSYARVGADPEIGFTNELFFAPGGFPFGSTAGFNTPTVGANPVITPEFTTSYEFGFESAFLKNRIRLNATYFNAESTDGFIDQGASRASGISVFKTNSGSVVNKGIEIDLGLTPIKTDNFKWDISLNLTKIDNEVTELGEGTDRVQIGTVGLAEAAIFAQVGEPYPSLFATAYTRDDQGRVVIDPLTGRPIVSSELKNLGTTTPDLIIGGSTTFTFFDDLSLSLVGDYKTGHVYYNTLVDALEFTGSTQHSASANRQPFVFPNSSYADGNGGFIENTNILTNNGGFSFFNNTYNAIKENYVSDATTLKLREVALNYNMPNKFFDGTFIQSVNVGLVARNLIMIRSAENVYTDPEFTVDANQVTGFGTLSQLPPTANYGFKLGVNF